MNHQTLWVQVELGYQILRAILLPLLRLQPQVTYSFCLYITALQKLQPRFNFRMYLRKSNVWIMAIAIMVILFSGLICINFRWSLGKAWLKNVLDSQKKQLQKGNNLPSTKVGFENCFLWSVPLYRFPLASLYIHSKAKNILEIICISA